MSRLLQRGDYLEALGWDVPGWDDPALNPQILLAVAKAKHACPHLHDSLVEAQGVLIRERQRYRRAHDIMAQVGQALTRGTGDGVIELLEARRPAVFALVFDLCANEVDEDEAVALIRDEVVDRVSSFPLTPEEVGAGEVVCTQAELDVSFAIPPMVEAGWIIKGRRSDGVVVFARVSKIEPEIEPDSAQVAAVSQEAGPGHSDPGAQLAPENSVAVRRNDPCPCGSGKKYKRCHGA